MKLLARLLMAFALLGLAACGEGQPRKYQFDDGQKGANVEDPPKGPHPQAIIETSKGDIKIELYEKAAPITVRNFIEYVKDEHYDNTIFHRVIEDFMIQGGGFSTSMKEKKTGDSIKNESHNGLQNKRGTLAMARTGDPHSATAQFFINVKDNSFLNKAEADDGWGYAVFGRVIEGMDVVDEIRNVPTGKKILYIQKQEAPSGDVPLKNVKIHTIRMVEQKQEKEKKKAEEK